MKNVKGWWMPDYDYHFEKQIIEGHYQKYSRDFTLKKVKNFNTIAIDIGANIGFWTSPLCEKFNHVYAFEPFLDNCKCLEKNVTSENYTLYNLALGKEEKDDQVLYSNAKNCGAGSLNSEWATTDSGETTSVHTLDSYNLTNVGYIKIDVQGTEEEVILGSLETLKNNDVCLVVELPRRSQQEKHTHRKMKELLASHGYKWQPRQFKKEAVFLK